jgi:nitrogen regulatory protein PII
VVKIEVVIGGDDVSYVEEVFRAAGAVGFTAIPNVSGFGHSGYHEGRLAFNDRSSLQMLVVVVPEERAAEIIAGVRALLGDRAGVLMVTESWVSRPEYFR